MKMKMSLSQIDLAHHGGCAGLEGVDVALQSATLVEKHKQSAYMC
jgi:hypothetical protein